MPHISWNLQDFAVLFSKIVASVQKYLFSHVCKVAPRWFGTPPPTFATFFVSPCWQELSSDVRAQKVQKFLKTGAKSWTGFFRLPNWLEATITGSLKLRHPHHPHHEPELVSGQGNGRICFILPNIYQITNSLTPLQSSASAYKSALASASTPASIVRLGMLYNRKW